MGSRLESNSTAVRKRIESHTFDDEQGEEYEPSKFGGFPEYFRRKKIKLQNLDVQLRSESADKPQIFRGIVAHVNGYTQPSLNDLHVLIVTHGGGFIQYLDGKTQVTHIIASNLTPKKIEEFKRYRIVKPAWIVDSVEEGRIIPWEKYRLVDEGTRQKVLRFSEDGVTSEVNQKRAGYRDQTEKSWYTKQLASDTSTNIAESDHDQERFDFDSSDLFSSDGSDLYGLADQAMPAEPASIAPDKSQSKAEELEISLERHHTPKPFGLHGPVKGPATDLGNDSKRASPRPQSASHRSPSSEQANFRRKQDCIDVTEKDQGDPSGPVTDDVRTVEQDERSLKRKSEDPLPQPEKRAKMSAEDHNRELLSDPRIRKSSVLNPEFLEQYYRESRLHHLSTWKADLKSQLQALTAERSASQKARQKRASNARRYILHVDFDSFFVAVSLKNHPHLQDKPAVVAHGAGSGSEIASCNYAARRYGVKNGMWMKRAQEMCDDLKVLPYDFPAYEAASRLFYDAILETGGFVQSVSIDEALVDLSRQCHAAGGTNGTGVHEGSIWGEQAKADEIAQDLRDRVKRESGCAVSVGIGGNILLAKLALRKAKPAGQHQIKPEDVLDFTGPLEVQSLPGVAYSIGGKLEEIGIKFVKDIREMTKERLVSALGPKTGEKIWNYSRGIDRTEVGDQVVRKSVSAEVNWGVRFINQEQAEEFMISLSGELSRRLVKEGVKGRNLTMKVMRRAKDAPMDPPKHLGHGKCDIHNKTVALGVLTNDRDVISKETISILRGFGFTPGELRGLGVQMTKLEPIRLSAVGNRDGSQRRLQFNVTSRPGKAKSNANSRDTVAQDQSKVEEIAGLQASHSQEASRPGSQFKRSEQHDTNQSRQIHKTLQDDIQDYPTTPTAKRVSRSVQSQLMSESPSKKPLNTLGTQFMLPTQVDPNVLAELPTDIRAKLERHLDRSKNQLHVDQAQPSEYPDPRPVAFTALPNQSQIDPEILEALPEDVRKDIVSQYAKSPSKSRPQLGQTVLPQSPRKNRTIKTAGFSRGTTRGRPRGGSLLARLRGATTRSSNPTLTQANFVAAHQDSDSDTNGVIAPEFLEALPDELRAEVMENHRKEQLKRKAGLEVWKRRRQLSRRSIDQPIKQGGERVFRLESRPLKATFTQRKLSEPQDLRKVVTSWYNEFKEDGPYEEDVDELSKYLRSVVVDERDMLKAVNLVKWLALAHEQSPNSSTGDSTDASQQHSSGATKAWMDVVLSLKNAANEAAHCRGLGAFDFEL